SLAVLDQRVVERGARDALLEQHVGLRELLVDHGLEFVERLRPDEATTVDEEVRRPRRLEVVAQSAVSLDPCLERPGLHGRHGLRRGELRIASDSLEVAVVELRLAVEESVVDVPEPGVALLCTSEARQLRGRLRTRMEGERLVAPYDADLVTVLTTD